MSSSSASVSASASSASSQHPRPTATSRTTSTMPPPSKKRKYVSAEEQAAKLQKQTIRQVEDDMQILIKAYNTQMNKTPFYQQKKRETIVRSLKQIARRLFTPDELQAVLSTIDSHVFRMVGPHQTTVDNIETQRKELIQKLGDVHGFLAKFRDYKQCQYVEQPTNGDGNVVHNQSPTHLFNIALKRVNELQAELATEKKKSEALQRTHHNREEALTRELATLRQQAVAKNIVVSSLRDANGKYHKENGAICKVFDELKQKHQDILNESKNIATENTTLLRRCQEMGKLVHSTREQLRVFQQREQAIKKLLQ